MPSSSSSTVWRFLEQSAENTIASGNPQTWRVTGGAITQSTSSIPDNELRSDRGKGDSTLVSGSVAGSINVNWSHGTHEELLSALLAADPTPVAAGGTKTVADMTFNTTTHIIGSAAANLPVLAKGQYFGISGAASALNNGIYRASLTTAPTTTEIVVETVVKDVAADAIAEECVISSTRYLQGNDTPRFFTIERELADVSKFHTFKDIYVTSLNLSYSPSERVSASFGFMGAEPEVHGNVSLFPGIATAVAATTSTTFNTVVGTHVILDGSDLGEGCLSSLTLDLNAGARERRCLGAGLAPSSIAFDSHSCTASGSIFFGTDATSTLYNKMLTDLPVNFSMCVTDADGNGFAISIPRAKLTSASIDGGSAGSDVLMAFSFETSTDPTLGSMVAFDVIGAL